jgi:epoxyqueuosine reductase
MPLRPYLSEHGIDLCGVLPLDACTIKRPYLLERAGFSPESKNETYVCLFAVPYLTPTSDTQYRNLSAYAVSEDYHVFFARLYDALLARLRSDFPDHRFAAFVDHSPIDEIDAAVLAGLGVRGLNHLLLTERHSSYVFLGEIITDLPLTPTPTALPEHLRVCHKCGACLRACPMETVGGECRSALTQKKGALREDESRLLATFPSLWGCDVCQEVCPYTAHARRRGTLYTKIPFFHQNTIATLSLDALDEMDDESFSRRAYAWRGRDVIRRNLLVKQSTSTSKETED